jgi:hypothetical protein
MKIKRDLASIPHRSAAETWSRYQALVTGTGSMDVGQLDAAASVMISLITDEAFKERPLTLTGVGDRLVVYLTHGQDALEIGDDVDLLNWNPTAGDWRLFVPSTEEQYDWVKKTLAARAPRLFVLRPEEEIREEPSRTGGQNATVEVNWEAICR